MQDAPLGYVQLVECRLRIYLSLIHHIHMVQQYQLQSSENWASPFI